MLAIRMQRTGRKGHAMFRIVVQESRYTPKSGKVVAQLGSYDPHTKAVSVVKDKAEFYLKNGLLYSEQKLQHAFASLLEIKGLTRDQVTATYFKELLQEVLTTKAWMVKNIYESRAKDYQNEFRKMAYDSEEEMENVIGKLDENSFINQQQEELAEMKELIQAISKNFAL